ncbi:MAG TPA: STAS domain-containing protein [Ottowia sp.]|nr:STAS domain-containing protein [Ottowia sp.]HNJ45646.1 STAS domain-containing protein [Ottowia sp.]HNL41081.1 STAS domain-containing protein [Ottowia sp.]HNN33582.1 STAS domain-containing protein [Ottowia sp.]
MNKPTEPGGLLSKVVRFVKNPTTHWADLDQPDSEDGDSQSRLALKEMIERKRRNDFVRSREFDMLRKLRRRETLKGSDLAAGPPSFYPSSQPANTGERELTLKKIDEIEAQMSTAWSRHRVGKDQAAGPAADAISEPSVHAYDKTDPMPLPPPPEGGAPLLDAAADGSASALAKESLSAQPLHPSAGGAAAARAIPWLGEVQDFNVEVMAAGRQDPEIEEAAILFANGDGAGAEALLRALVAEGGARREDVDTWLTLFDLYRCIGDQARFDDAAPEFAAQFGRSAPQWTGMLDRPSSGVSPLTAAPAPGATAAGPFHWISPSALGTQSMATLRMSLERHAPPWRLDWRHLQSIEAAALPSLVEQLQRWGRTPVRLKLLGIERLMDVLTERSPTGDRTVDPQWWEARLALLRVLGQMDEFDLVALNYCVTYEVSPPAWEDPVNGWTRMNEEGETLMSSRFGSDTLGVRMPEPGGDEAPSHDTEEPPEGVVRTVLDGAYSGSMSALLQPLAQRGEVRHFEFNCRQLVRVDFGAAGDLLNWATEQQGSGRSISFKQVNRLVAAFFGVIGITDVSRVLLRTD